MKMTKNVILDDRDRETRTDTDILKRGKLREHYRYQVARYNSKFALSAKEMDIMDKYVEKKMSADLKRYNGRLNPEDYEIGGIYNMYWPIAYGVALHASKTYKDYNPTGEYWPVDFLHPSWPKVRSLSKILKDGNMEFDKILYYLYFRYVPSKKYPALSKKELMLLSKYMQGRYDAILSKERRFDTLDLIDMQTSKSGKLVYYFLPKNYVRTVTY